MFVLKAVECIMNCRSGNVHVFMRWDENGCDDDRSELSRQVEGVAFVRWVFQVWCKRMGENSNAPSITPVVTGHKTDSPSFGYSGLLHSVYIENRAG